MTDVEQDEQILAAILAAAHACGREVRPHSGHDGVSGSHNGYGVNSWDDRQGPCCAIGVGLLYSGMKVADHDHVLDVFARAYGVTWQYASGVSSGFEDKAGGRGPRDFLRGAEVGRVAFEILCLENVE